MGIPTDHLTKSYLCFMFY